jgi:hypothetical protein
LICEVIATVLAPRRSVANAKLLGSVPHEETPGTKKKQQVVIARHQHVANGARAVSSQRAIRGVSTARLRRQMIMALAIGGP